MDYFLDSTACYFKGYDAVSNGHSFRFFAFIFSILLSQTMFNLFTKSLMPSSLSSIKIELSTNRRFDICFPLATISCSEMSAPLMFSFVFILNKYGDNMQTCRTPLLR